MRFVYIEIRTFPSQSATVIPMQGQYIQNKEDIFQLSCRMDSVIFMYCKPYQDGGYNLFLHTMMDTTLFMVCIEF